MDQLRKQPHGWWAEEKPICGIKKQKAVLPLITYVKLLASASEKAKCSNSAFRSTMLCSAVSEPSIFPPLYWLCFLLFHHYLWECSQATPWSHYLHERLQVPTKYATVCWRDVPACLGLSLKEGMFYSHIPRAWKTAIVMRYFKQKGELCQVKNYQPISLLPSVQKSSNTSSMNNFYMCTALQDCKHNSGWNARRCGNF